MKAPVFFAFENEQTDALRAAVERGAGDTQLVSETTETPRKQSQVDLKVLVRLKIVLN